MKRDMHKFTLDLTATEHRNMKSFCAKNGLSMRQFMRDLINKHMNESREELECCTNRSYEPNEETLQSLRNIDEGKKLTTFTSLKDLYKKVGK